MTTRPRTATVQTTAPRSMTLTKYHLEQARDSATIAISHLSMAEMYDPDPEKTEGDLYAPMLQNLLIIQMACVARIAAGAPDLEREAKK